ncbi:hypothetical protein TNCT_127461 [Trichonephila clavata]|uniref:EF-hand domain-containing protein n=1 Tax=Trichonephila clavata TaxID=2740835 RepID=A0A8X6JKI7_TRICU|nr:hypothetical protein TNCT_127461 [Trichonephila clavata]
MSASSTTPPTPTTFGLRQMLFSEFSLTVTELHQLEFLECLSVICRGSLCDKLDWAFALYDLNADGRITKKELTDIVYSVYNLMGRKAYTDSEEKAFKEHVDKVFRKMDINKDGIVTKEEFMEICSKDETIVKSLELFDTIL